MLSDADGGLVTDQGEAADGTPFVGADDEAVEHVAGRPQERAVLRRDILVPQLRLDPPAQEVERLVLVVVDVRWREACSPDSSAEAETRASRRQRGCLCRVASPEPEPVRGTSRR